MTYHITTIDRDGITRYYRNQGIRWITKVAGAQAYTASQLDAVIADIKNYNPDLQLAIVPA